MVGVADVDAERQAEQLAAEMVLEAGADDLLAVIEIFGADEADHAVDEQRLKRAGDRIATRLAGLLIDAVMGAGRECGALAGLEIHQIVTDGAALERAAGVKRLAQEAEIDSEALVRRLGPGDRL